MLGVAAAAAANGVSARRGRCAPRPSLALVRSSVRVYEFGSFTSRDDVVHHTGLEMAMSCFLCEQPEQRSKEALEIPSDILPEDEDRWKKWLDAIGEADGEVLAQLSLCPRHFSQACSAGLILTDKVTPILEPAPSSSDSIAKAAGMDRSSPKRETRETKGSSSPLSHTLLPTIRRPTITRGRRVHMLTEEEMKEQPIKYVRFLKNVNWDEISKVPAEAKIVWEVAMEELKEDNVKIKHLQAHARQLKATVQQLRNAQKTRKRNATTAIH